MMRLRVGIIWGHFDLLQYYELQITTFRTAELKNLQLHYDKNLTYYKFHICITVQFDTTFKKPLRLALDEINRTRKMRIERNAYQS
jgi:hypothetical protein